MATEDHLDKETSVSLALKDAGVEFKTKSRAIAVIDRMAANFFERRGFKGERLVQIGRQKIDIELSLIKRASETLLKRVETDERFAESILAATFEQDTRRQLNKDGVIEAALEQLSRDPPGEVDSSSGPDELSPEFSDRFERYAEDASTDQLRERWGKVLASEVKKPGTFSTKVMRVIDELDSRTASLFERIVQYRVGETLLQPIMPELEFKEQVSLVSAGLLVDPGMAGHVTRFNGGRQDNGGAKLWLFPFGTYLVGLEQSVALTYGTAAPIKDSEGGPAVPVYLLTDVGKALSTIIPTDENVAGLSFYAKLKDYPPSGHVRLYAKSSNGQWQTVSAPA
ncbi:DUF2806 domain-containing protein [Candidatus Phyllobacterium onerii]|uniref:DUF2806 domain-containing protein n=1 Tax=Candidatus Phyllobacterium onerii TaxID=3020828 RepID=UPI00232BF0F7|nr:DUF2806 domain-containing protein [Phyllobacterium sp. IY22]